MLVVMPRMMMLITVMMMKVVRRPDHEGEHGNVTDIGNIGDACDGDDREEDFSNHLSSLWWYWR